MGFFSDHYETTYEGHRIEIEARVISLLGTCQYDLIVDNKKVDRIEGLHGAFQLRGFIEDGQKSIRVRMNQSFARTEYQLYIENQLIPLTRRL